MVKPHTSSADEEESQDTVLSEKSASQPLPENTETPILPENTETPKDQPLYLIEELEQLPDLDLVKIGLAAMAVLHRRAIEIIPEGS